MAIVIFAGKQVGLKCLEYLLSSGYAVAHVVVAHMSDHEILALLRKHAVLHHVFESKDATFEALRSARYEWILNLWSPHILPERVLNLADHRLNIHPSHAPHGLGSDSATWAIRENVTPGVSLLEMSTSIDAGGIFAQQQIDWNFPEPAKSLFERLKSAAFELFASKWPEIYCGHITASPQTGPGSYHTLKMTKADRRLAGSNEMSVKDLIYWALAHDFSPTSAAEVVLESGTYNLTLTLTKKLATS